MAETIENQVRKILEQMNQQEGSTPTLHSVSAASSYSQATTIDYPIAEKHPEWVKTSSGKTFNEITLENVMNGTITKQDVRITADMLNAQGSIARDAGRPAIKKNFDRAAELVSVPDERILDIYNALRPYRSSRRELEDIAEELESRYNAKICAAYVREAAQYYEKRKKLKGDN